MGGFIKGVVVGLFSFVLGFVVFSVVVPLNQPIQDMSGGQSPSSSGEHMAEDDVDADVDVAPEPVLPAEAEAEAEAAQEPGTEMLQPSEVAQATDDGEPMSGTPQADVADEASTETGAIDGDEIVDAPPERTDPEPSLIPAAPAEDQQPTTQSTDVADDAVITSGSQNDEPALDTTAREDDAGDLDEAGVDPAPMADEIPEGDRGAVEPDTDGITLSGSGDLTSEMSETLDDGPSVPAQAHEMPVIAEPETDTLLDDRPAVATAQEAAEAAATVASTQADGIDAEETSDDAGQEPAATTGMANDEPNAMENGTDAAPAPASPSADADLDTAVLEGAESVAPAPPLPDTNPEPVAAPDPEETASSTGGSAADDNGSEVVAASRIVAQPTDQEAPQTPTSEPSVQPMPTGAPSVTIRRGTESTDAGREQDDADATASTEPLTERPNVVEGVTVGRLATVGGAEEASQPDAANAVIVRPAYQRFAAPLEPSDSAYRLGVVLLETPESEQNILELPFQATIAMDPYDPDGPRRADAYRWVGHDVVILASGVPALSTASDIEVTLQVWMQSYPQIVAVMDVPLNGIGSNRALAGEMARVLTPGGYGVITLRGGLDAFHQSAQEAGLATGSIFRTLDDSRQPLPTIRRLIDRAAFEARRNSAIIIGGSAANADTLVALQEFAQTEGRGAVRLVPASAMLVHE